MTKDELIMFSEKIRKQPEPILSPESLAEIEAVKEELREEEGRERVNARIVDSTLNYRNELVAKQLDKEDKE